MRIFGGIITVFMCVCTSILNASIAQEATIRIAITSNDSIFRWFSDIPSGSVREFSLAKGTVIDFNNVTHQIVRMQTMCGRGNCGNGVEIYFHPNGIMASKGSYEYTINEDGLKEVSKDGLLQYVDKGGYWYYWNEQGFLTKREKWMKGKLVETINFKTTRLALRKK